MLPVRRLRPVGRDGVLPDCFRPVLRWNAAVLPWVCAYSRRRRLRSCSGRMEAGLTGSRSCAVSSGRNGS